MECKRGTGRFQWSTGGWFGAQVGSTCWMLACGLWLLVEARPLAGALLLGCFAAANALGTYLWAKRDRLDPYKAIQSLIGLIFCLTTAALGPMSYCGLLGRLDERLENPKSLFLILLLFPAMMIWFHFLNGPRTSSTQTTSSTTEPDSSGE